MSKLNKTTNNYLVLCYHYIRQSAGQDPFPRVLGNTWDDFSRHLGMLLKNFNIISLDTVVRFHKKKEDLSSAKPNILLTFDDGLAEHYPVARVLAEHGIKAVFFIPSCLITEKIPINSAILHYTIARYGIGLFLEVFNQALLTYDLDQGRYKMVFKKGTDDPKEKIVEIKNMFKYQLSYSNSQKVILYVYKNLLLKNDPNIFESIHLTTIQMKGIIALRHDVGVHSHSHVSIASAKLTSADWQKEVIEPKNILESTLGVKVQSISYPFGEKKDYDSLEKKIKKTKCYQTGFIAEPAVNTSDTLPFKIARYLALKTDKADVLYNKLRSLQDGKEITWKY